MEKNKNEKFISVDKIIESLLDKKEHKLVVLCENSSDKKFISKDIGNKLREKPEIKINGELFRVQTNMVQVGNNKVFLGLKGDEKYLVDHYSSDIIKYLEIKDA